MSNPPDDLPTVSMEISGEWRAPSSSATCTADPCPVCAGCTTCRDFHGYTGHGCTTDNCPLEIGEEAHE